MWSATAAGRQHSGSAGAAISVSFHLVQIYGCHPCLALTFNGKRAQSRKVIYFLLHPNQFLSHWNLFTMHVIMESEDSAAERIRVHVNKRFPTGMAKSGTGRPLTAEVLVWNHASPYGICGGQLSTETGFPPSTSVFPYDSPSTKNPVFLFESCITGAI